MTETTELARIFKALSDPNRLKILKVVRQCCGIDCSPDRRENTVSDIARQFDLSLSTVSHHLKELRNAGLIVCEKDGQSVRCTPNPEILDRIDAFIRG